MRMCILLMLTFFSVLSLDQLAAQDCAPVIDCNANGQEDSCDIAQGLNGDCDLNGIPDQCDIDASLLADCNMNGLLDVCEPVFPAITGGLATGNILMSGEYLLVCDPANPPAFDDEEEAPVPAIRSIEVYKRLGTSWRLDGTLIPLDEDALDGFGASMAMSENVAVISAPNKNENRGALYIFERQELGWTQTQVLVGLSALENDHFGTSVAINGSTIAIGAPQTIPEEEDNPVDADINTPSGFVEVWDHNGIEFERTSVLTNTDLLNGGGEEMGGTMALTDNNWLLIGSPSDGPPSGAGRILGYRDLGAGWELVVELSTVDSPTGAGFGRGLSWSNGTLAVYAEGALGVPVDGPRVGAVYTFENSADGNLWNQTDRLISADATSLEFGLSMQVNGDHLIIGDPSAQNSTGVVELYHRMADDTWALSAFIQPGGTAVGDNLGGAVGSNGEWIAFSSDGVNTVIEHREVVPDCNENGEDDRCEVRSEVVPDCNGNIIPDSCDIVSGLELDCDGDGVPDACFLASGGPDCNNNGIPDSCDIDSVQSLDCNLNGIPDECEDDCDQNGFPDDCDLANGTPDCNSNLIPDSCDIAAQFDTDCDLNTVPDGCDLAGGAADCDGDIILDSCQIAIDPSLDCDASQAIDSCELLANPGLDCNTNNTIDSCDIVGGTSQDCDTNGTPDECQIASGFSIDCNSNAIPDECEDPFLESTPPVFTSSVDNISLNTEPNSCTAAASWTNPSVTDNCTETPNITSSHVNGGQFNLGLNLVTLTATDEHGNDSTTTFSVTVTDIEVPTISNLPGPISVNNDQNACSAVVNWTEPTFADNCSVSTSGSDLPSGSTFNVGTHTVTYSGSDGSGNPVSASFQITVLDNQAPTFTSAPSNMEMSNDFDSCGAIVNWENAIPDDNCGILSTNSSHQSGSFFATGSTEVTVTTTDTAGISTEHLFTVTINDTQQPALLNMPAAMSVNNDLDECAAVVNWVAPGTSDNCAGETLQGSHESGMSFAVGSHTVEYTVTDTSGLTAAASFTITVTDNQLPVFDQAPMDMNLTTGLGTCEAVANWDSPVTSDNCLVQSVSSTFQSGDSFGVGSHLVEMTLEDNHGNSQQHQFNIVVQDLEQPEFSGMPTNIEQGNDPDSCGATITWTAPTSSDNCAINTLGSDVANGAFFQLGTTTVTYTTEDVNGNVNSASFDVIISDVQAPEISSLSGDITSFNDLGECGAAVSWSEPRATDNCDIASFTSTHASGDFFDLGSTLVTYTATDNSGNDLSGSFTITVSDNENPSIVGDLPDMNVLTDPDQCNAVVSWTDPSASDNCAGASIAGDTLNDSVFELGTTEVSYTATDASGNSVSASFSITVEDGQSPQFISAPGDVTLVTEPGICSASHQWADPETSDNCLGMTMNTSHASGADFGVGNTDVTMFLTDGSGNTVQHTFTVTVNDEEDPQLNGVPTDIIVSNDGGVCGANVSWAAPQGSDNCAMGDLATTALPGDFFELGTTTVTYLGADASGNVTSVDFTVTVNDDEGPVIATSGDVTIASPESNCGATVSIPAATASDNCQVTSLTNDINGGLDASGEYPYGTTVVTWTATDSAGNTSSVEQSITVTVDMTDCNNNGSPDVCEIADGTTVDCDGNGIPDSCDLSSGAAQDCNSSGIPDSCEIATGAAQDCDGNGTPDECDTDCNGNGAPDACDLSSGASQDCNENGQPDECDLSAGSSQDTNGNDTPDECEPQFRRGDANEDGAVDIADAIFMLYTLMLDGPESGCKDATDANDSGTHDIADVVFVLSYQFSNGATPPAPGVDNCGVDATPDDGMSCENYGGCP